MKILFLSLLPTMALFGALGATVQAQEIATVSQEGLAITAIAPSFNESLSHEIVAVTNTTEQQQELDGIHLQYSAEGSDRWHNRFDFEGYVVNADSSLVLSTEDLQDVNSIETGLGLAASGSLRLYSEPVEEVVFEVVWSNLDGLWQVDAFGNGGARSSFLMVDNEQYLKMLNVDFDFNEKTEEGPVVVTEIEELRTQIKETASTAEDDSLEEYRQEEKREQEGPGETVSSIAEGEIVITELFIDPQSPLTDAEDEFVELLNTTDRAIFLEGMRLYSGRNLSYSHTIKKLTIQPGEYRALFSSDTGLTLSNTEGVAVLVDGEGSIISRTDLYLDSEASQSYSLSSAGEWTFTTPTPGAANSINSIPDEEGPTELQLLAESLQDETVDELEEGEDSRYRGTELAYAPESETLSEENSLGQTASSEDGSVVGLRGILMVLVALIAVFAYATWEYRYEIKSSFRICRTNLRSWVSRWTAP